MSTQNAQQPQTGKALDIAIVTLAIVVAVAGLLAFTFLTEQGLAIRIGALVGGLVLACILAAISPSGKSLIAFGRDSYEELRRVVWPSKKETINTTGLVMAFVVAVSFYLFVVDKFIEWGLYDGLLRITF